MSREELAEKARVGIDAIGRFERGHQELGVWKLERCVAALNMTMEEFYKSDIPPHIMKRGKQ